MANGPFPGKCVGTETCTNPVNVKKRQMCLNHFHMWRRTLVTEKCSLEWCDNIVYAKKFCRSHYDVQRRGKPFYDPRAPKPVKPKCAAEPCDRESKSMGLCSAHYLQKAAGNEFTPIKPYVKEPDRDGNRLCKTCQQWKECEVEFYKTSGGTYQRECRACMIKRSAAHNLRRKLEKAGIEA